MRNIRKTQKSNLLASTWEMKREGCCKKAYIRYESNSIVWRGNTGKTRCLGHLINLINNEENKGDYLKVGKDARVTLEYRGKRITICRCQGTGQWHLLKLTR